MSLINQMLRDLQQQKKGGTTRKNVLTPKRVDSIPYLPMPVILGGVALIVVCLIWWLSGVVSDAMFESGSVDTASVAQQIDTAVPKQVVTDEVVVTSQPELLTAAERQAEPADEKSDAEKVVSASLVQEKNPSDVAASVANEVVDQPAVVKPAPATSVSQKKKMTRTPRLNQAPKPVGVSTAQSKTVARKVERLHADDLPGAVLSRRAVSPVDKIVRPSKISTATHLSPTTPYSMAEEAFLDGKWALDQKKINLAVSSLQHALELYPGHLPARELLAATLKGNGKTGEAMLVLVEGLEIAPDYIGFKKAYARLLMEQGDYDTATKTLLNRGMPAINEDPESHVLLAALYQRLNEPFLAAQTYRNLLVFWPQTGAFWVGLGSALEGQNLPQEAIECYRRSLQTEKLRPDLSAYAKERLALLK